MRSFAGKIEKNSFQNKMVGAYISKRDASRIALYCLLHDTSRQSIYSGLLDQFLKGIPTTDQLIEKAVERAVEDWIELRDKNIGVLGWKTPEGILKKWELYKQELVSDLKKKKIPLSFIEDIVKYAEEKS